MTKNQIEYRKAVETERANRESERVKRQEANIKEREAEIKAKEADVKERGQSLEESMADYNRLGNGVIGGIGRLITAFGKDTGIDSVIKDEARETNTYLADRLKDVKNFVGRLLNLRKDYIHEKTKH